MSRTATAILTFGLLLAIAAGARAGQLGALEFVTDGIAFPSNFVAHDGRTFVLEQYAGRVRVVADGELRPEPFLDLGDRLHPETSSGEGLLGIAFPPSDPDHVWLSWVDPERSLALGRFALADDGESADPASADVVFRFARDGLGSPCGHLEADPERGALYLCFGDDLADDAFNIAADDDFGLSPQALDSWPGKILRFDPTSPQALPEIVALGLHDPWRFALAPSAARLIVPDVGRFDWEEVNLVDLDDQEAPNFGWPLAEGPECVAYCQDRDLTLPLFTYAQGPDRCGIVGGTVYRGTRAPAFRGAFVFADRCSGEVFALRDLTGAAEIRRVATTTLLPSALGAGPDGEVLIADQADGALWRLRLPADGARGWQPVEHLMFAQLTRALGEGTTRSQVDLQKVVTSRSWRVGRDLARVYRWLKAFWIF